MLCDFSNWPSESITLCGCDFKVYLSNRLHLAVRVYSYNSQMMSKHGKKMSALRAASNAADVLTKFRGPCELYIRVKTHGEMESICFNFFPEETSMLPQKMCFFPRS